MSDQNKHEIPVQMNPSEHLAVVMGDVARQDRDKNRNRHQNQNQNQSQPRHQPSPMSHENASSKTDVVGIASLVVSVLVLLASMMIYGNTVPAPCPSLPELAKKTFQRYDSDYKAMQEAKKQIPVFIK